jgi:hypothetical protein
LNSCTSGGLSRRAQLHGVSYAFMTRQTSSLASSGDQRFEGSCYVSLYLTSIDPEDVRCMFLRNDYIHLQFYRLSEDNRLICYHLEPRIVHLVFCMVHVLFLTLSPVNYLLLFICHFVSKVYYLNSQNCNIIRCLKCCDTRFLTLSEESRLNMSLQEHFENIWS